MQFRLLRPALPRFAFSSAPPPADPNEPTRATKHNPLAYRELRGYEHIDLASENEKSYSPIHSTQPSALAAYSLFQKLPNRLARWMGSLFAHPQSTIASDSLYLPRIHPNGQPLYDSLDKASTYIVINRLVTQVCPINILLFVPQPTLSLMLYGLLYYIYQGTNWTLASRLVIKAELLPETEQLVYQKVTRLGSLATSTIPISDLQHVTFDEVFGENNYSEKSVRGLVNREVAFRVKSTGELLLFDRNGIWNPETLSHALLV